MFVRENCLTPQGKRSGFTPDDTIFIINKISFYLIILILTQFFFFNLINELFFKCKHNHHYVLYFHLKKNEF